MRITESRIRQIIREETKSALAGKRKLSEGKGRVVSMRSLVMYLDDAGEEELSQKLDLYNRRLGGDAAVELDVRRDRVALYVDDRGRTGNYMFDIPLNVLRKVGLDESRRGGKRALRENHDDGRWLAGHNGYEFEGMPELERAWSDFTDAVARLQSFAHDKFEDTEAGDEASVADVAAHQVQIILAQS